MNNAMKELLENLTRLNKEPQQVKCAIIARTKSYNVVDCPSCIIKNPDKFADIIILRENWGTDDWLAFLELLDFNYDSGYGQQELMGCVWFTDETWLERGEYDGAEWWEYRSTPIVPRAVVEGHL